MVEKLRKPEQGVHRIRVDLKRAREDPMRVVEEVASTRDLGHHRHPANIVGMLGQIVAEDDFGGLVLHLGQELRSFRKLRRQRRCRSGRGGVSTTNRSTRLLSSLAASSSKG